MGAVLEELGMATTSAIVELDVLPAGHRIVRILRARSDVPGYEKYSSSCVLLL